MEKFGPLINLWEGGNKGEGYLRFVKPKITDIHSKNWQINAHSKLFSERSLESVINHHIMNNTEKQIIKQRDKKRMLLTKMWAAYILYYREINLFHA